MCVAIPGRIKKESGNHAAVEILGNVLDVNIQLIDRASEGDFVLVHAGCAIQKIDAEYYNFLNEFYTEYLEKT